MTMDCDDVILLLAKEPDTLTGTEATQLQHHVGECDSCERLALDTADERWRWVARLPEDAFDDPDLLVLPMVDPIVFEAGPEIASGGMGRITRARDRRLGRDVAIKEMLDADLRARFEREATITARLQHPAIVPIYEAGTWPNGAAFYTMRLVQGGTLAQAIDRKPTLEQRLGLLPHVVAVTEALAYAHAHKIIHRDLKPQNVLVGEFGETVVIDWGLAKELDRDVEPAVPLAVAHGGATHLTIAGSVLGTPCFMPPEQAAGEPLDERADVFSLGALLYNVLAGAPPYWDTERDTPQKLIDTTKRHPPTPIGELAPSAPEDLRAIVERAMSRDKTARYPTAREMAEELRRFQAGKLIASRDYRMRDLVARWVARHRAVVAVAAAAVVVLAAVGVVSFVNITKSRDAEREARVAADRAHGSVDASVAALLEEQGRSELVAGHRDRALAYLAEAYRMGRSGVAIRHLLAEATRELGLLEHSLEAGSDDVYTNVGFRADGKLLTFAGRTKGRLDVWDGDKIVDSFGMGFEASSAVFSSTGTRAAILGATELAMFDLDAGKKLWTVNGDYSGTSVVFDPDAKRIAVLSQTPVVVRDVATGKVVGNLDAKDKTTTAATFSLGGELVATSSSEGLIAVWQLEPTVEVLGSLRIPRTLTDIAFAGVQIVVTTKEHEAYIWKAGDTEYHVIGGHRDELTALAVTPDGGLIATGDRSGGVKLWNETGELVGESSEPRGAIQFLQFSPDLHLLVGGGEDPRTYLWNTSLGMRAVLQAPDDQYDAITGVAWGPKDRLATVDDSGKHVHVWHKPRAGMVLHAKGKLAGVGASAVALFQDDGLVVHDLAKGKRIHTVAKAIAPADRTDGRQLDGPHMLVTADGRRALAWGEKAAVVYDLVAEKELRTFAASDVDVASVTKWILSSDGKRAVEIASHRVRVFDIDSGAVVLDRNDDSAGPGGALSPAGDRLVFANEPMLVWRIPSGEVLAQPPLDVERQKTRSRASNGAYIFVSSGPTSVVFDPTGVRMLALQTATPLVIDVATGKTLAQLHQMPVAATTGMLDDGGRHAATQTLDAAMLWDADRGTLLFSVPGTAPGAIALTRDGTRLATGHPDGTVRIWDDRGRLLEVIHDHHRAIAHLEFTADGTRLVAEARDGWISVADVHLEQRTPTQISAIAAKSSSWQVVGGALVPATAK